MEDNIFYEKRIVFKNFPTIKRFSGGPMKMCNNLIITLLFLIVGCGDKNNPAMPPPPPEGRTYSLVSIFYEDVVPGQYHIVASTETIEGGPGLWTFLDNGTGNLSVTTTLSILFVDSLSGANERRAILSAGGYAFIYQLDSIGVPTFNRTSPWPFVVPTTVADSIINQNAKTCYDNLCEDRTVLAVIWRRT